MKISKGKLFPRLLFIIMLIPHMGLTQGGMDKPMYEIVTHRAGSYLGTFNIELFPIIAPLHVNNFDSLVSEQFYDSTAFHRVVPGFVIQGGDPNSISGPISTWGQGQPWQPTVPAEFNPVRHLRGILGAARGPNINSATSQFYICVANATFLDNNYTVYGKVTNGMDVVDTIVASPRDANDVPLQKIEMFITHTGFNDTIPDTPSLTIPSNGAQNLLNTASFICSTVNNAVLYHFEISEDSTFNTIDFTLVSGVNSTTGLPLEGSKTYYWRALANNGGHLSVPSPVNFFTTATGAPDLIVPADGATGVSTDPVFRWSQVNGATDYTLQVSKSSTFIPQNLVYDQSGIPDTFQTVTGLDPSTVYYWRTRSADTGVQGFYSTKFSFTTGTGTGQLEIDNGELNILSIYPNPVSNIINVDFESAHDYGITVELYNIANQRLMSREITVRTGKSTMPIPIGEIASGHYLLTFSSESGTVTHLIQVK